MVESASTAKTFEAFSLRIPALLRERVRTSAIVNRRSVNAEMLVLLERALPAEKKTAEAVGSAPAE
jgi:hypothetical protein